MFLGHGGFPSSALLVDSDNKHHFEKRYSLWLQQLPNAEPGDTTNGLSGADAATLVSLIAAPEPLNDAIRIAAHQTAVDHASVALRDIMLRDMSGSAATKVIQGGALARLLMLALKSPSSAGCSSPSGPSCGNTSMSSSESEPKFNVGICFAIATNVSAKPHRASSDLLGEYAHRRPVER